MSDTPNDSLDVLSAADLFASQMDENGYMPDDDNFVETDVEEVEEEEVEEEETEEVEEDLEEESEEEEVEQKVEEEEDKLYELEIGEDVYEVNLEELKAGYLRQEEFVGRSTKLEAEFEEKVTELTQKEVQIEAELDALVAMQNHEINRFRGIDWQEMKLIDPEQYHQLRTEFHEAKERVQMFQARKGEMARIREEAEAVKHQAYLEKQQTLAAQLIPEFKDPEFQKKVVKFAEKIGYTETEVRGIADARHLMLLNQARLYEESQLKRKEALEKKVPKEVPKVTKPGVTKPAGKVKASELKSAASNLKSSGSINAARDYFLKAGLV